MKKFTILTSIILSVVMLSVTLTYAWLTDNGMTSEFGFISRIHRSYFESGDGKGIDKYDPDEHGEDQQDCAYEIKYPVQLYHFAWLQYMGYFNANSTGDHTSSGRTVETFYFYLSSDLDMTGWILPPVGTQTYPFLGNFDGNNHTISNLTVQNVNQTAAQQAEDIMGLSDIPINENDLAGVEIVGVFGVVGSLPEPDYSYDSSRNKVENLIIENATIITETEQSLAGIAAGYVYDQIETPVDFPVMSNIKVDGTSIIKSTATESLSYTDNLSDFTLVGYTNNTDHPVWVQNVELKTPNIKVKAGNGSAIITDDGGAGGDLVIAPDGIANSPYTAFGDAVGVGSSRAVAGAADLTATRKSAYYYGELGATTTKAKGKYYKYNQIIEFPESGDPQPITVTGSSSDSNVINSSTASYDESYLSFLQYVNNKNGFGNNIDFNMIVQQGVPVFPTDKEENGDLKYPTNCVWFQPLNTGHCFVAFCVQNMSSDAYISIYRYKRNPDGSCKDKQEMILTFQAKNSSLKNKEVVLFDININDTSYEYCIAQSSTSSNQAYLFFLKLAGTDSQGGNGISEGVSGSEFAIYEQMAIRTSSLATPNGVSFMGDPTAVFQINMQNNNSPKTYTFTSGAGTTTTSLPYPTTPPGSEGDIIIMFRLTVTRLHQIRIHKIY